MIAQRNARDREIRAPYHMESKVDWPDAPVPKIQRMVKPNFSMAASGESGAWQSAVHQVAVPVVAA